MDMTRENTLELIGKIKSTKCANWSDIAHSSLLTSSKSCNLII